MKGSGLALEVPAKDPIWKVISCFASVASRSRITVHFFYKLNQNQVFGKNENLLNDGREAGWQETVSLIIRDDEKT